MKRKRTTLAIVSVFGPFLGVIIISLLVYVVQDVEYSAVFIATLWWALGWWYTVVLVGAFATLLIVAVIWLIPLVTGTGRFHHRQVDFSNRDEVLSLIERIRCQIERGESCDAEVAALMEWVGCATLKWHCLNRGILLRRFMTFYFMRQRNRM